jgi:hypothetical protein
MAAIKIDLNPDASKLRQFGFIALVAFGLIGGYVLWRGGLFGFDFGAAARPVAYILIGLGALSGLLSLMAPRANRPLYVGLVVLTYPIGFVVSYVIMGVLFYLVITPVGLVFRLLRRDSLTRRIDRDAPTYWVARPEGELAKERYFKQF